MDFNRALNCRVGAAWFAFVRASRGFHPNGQKIARSVVIRQVVKDGAWSIN
jgi:hypothetical protein